MAANSLQELKKGVLDLELEVDDFCEDLEEIDASSPGRKTRLNRAKELKRNVESLLSEILQAGKDGGETGDEVERLKSLKERLEKIEEQMEPDEVEDEYFRKVQEEEMASTTGSRASEAVEGSVADSANEEDDEDSEVSDPTIEVHKVEALSDYVGTEDTDLSFKKGEILTIKEIRQDGWWIAENGAGKRGMVPNTYLKILQAKSESTTKSPAANSEQPGPVSFDVVPALPSSVPSPQKTPRGKELWKKISKQETSVTDVIKALGGMPAGFRSATLGKLAKEAKYELGAWVVPKLNPSNLAYKDLHWDQVEKKLRSRTVKMTRTFTVVSALSIPPPGTGVERITGRFIRVCLWDGCNVLSNVHTMKAVAVQKDISTWKMLDKSKNLPSLYDGECLARINSTNDILCLLFELNITYVRKNGQKGETACGWGTLKLFEDNGTPAGNRNYELQLAGGNPGEAGVQLDPSVPLPKASTNLFSSIVSASRHPRLIVKLTSYSKAAKEEYDTLPDTLVCCQQYTPFISYYRLLVADHLLSDEELLQNVNLTSDPVLGTFSQALSYSDIMDALRKCWEDRSRRLLTRAQRRDSAYMKRFFREVYLSSAFPILHSASIPGHVLDDEHVEGDRCAWILNFLESKTAVAHLLSSDYLHKPFNIDRISHDFMGEHCLPVV